MPTLTNVEVKWEFPLLENALSSHVQSKYSVPLRPWFKSSDQYTALGLGASALER